jgi:Amt family ammonium transporter
MASILIGCVASVICYYCILFRTKRKIDESLDVWAVHGMGGVWGAIATGLFATVAVNPNGANGLFLGNAALLGKQVVDVLAVAVFSFGLTWILAKIIDRFFGLRVKDEEESVGLDISQHGERAYGGV